MSTVFAVDPDSSPRQNTDRNNTDHQNIDHQNADHLLDGLNPAQLRAVTTTTSPLCILAGAGSGKTRVLTRRIAWRAATGDLDPRHVLALTFTRKAAGELTSRLRALGLREQVAAGTFHAVAYAQLRTRWAERNIAPPTLMTRKVGFVASMLTTAERAAQAIDFVAEIEWAKARMIEPDQYPSAARTAGRKPPISFDATAAVYERYESERRVRRQIDFDDMLRVCLRDLQSDESFAKSQRWRFAHLFVDEFQDVNPLQNALLEAWRGDRPDLCVVGDPNQAIYSWNGADPDLIRTFGTRFPTAEVVRLTSNYRSTPQILAVANSLLVGGSGVDTEGALESTRPDGPVPLVREYPDDSSEAAGIARSVRDHHGPGARWSSQAVLVRTNAQIPALEESMRAVSIPFRVRGATPLLEHPEIKVAMAELRRSSAPFADALRDLAQSIDTDDATEGELAAERRANVDALVQLGHDYIAIESPPSTPGFLLWLTATTRADQPDPNGDAVEIMTFHAAKGLEWPVVHLAGIEQGLVPIGHAKTADAWAEERRLFYVAATRAERELICSWAKSRRFANNVMHRDRSEFLDTLADACEALDAGIDPGAVGKGATAPDRAPAADRPRTRTAKRAAGARRPPSKYPEGLDTEDRELFDALRAWRSDRSKKADVPAFVVCNDHTLAEIASARPHTPSELLRVNGMGEIKVSKFGEEIIAVVVATD
jgi:DNA helicase-2/ATP-dependent DNA helicase PcrA